MRTKLTRVVLVLTAALLALTVLPMASAMAMPFPIEPDNTFTGLVIGPQGQTTTIKVACSGTTGNPAADQYLEVEPTTGTGTDQGFTGTAADSILEKLTTATGTIDLTSTESYFSTVGIPTYISVPCSGTGTISFIPSPTSPTAVTAKLKITFVRS